MITSMISGYSKVFTYLHRSVQVSLLVICDCYISYSPSRIASSQEHLIILGTNHAITCITKITESGCLPKSNSLQSLIRIKALLSS